MSSRGTPGSGRLTQLAGDIWLTSFWEKGNLNCDLVVPMTFCYRLPGLMYFSGGVGFPATAGPRVLKHSKATRRPDFYTSLATLIMH